MHPPKRSFLRIIGDAALSQSIFKSIGSQFFLAPGPGKKTPFISKPLRFDYVYTFELNLSEDHGRNRLGVIIF